MAATQRASTTETDLAPLWLPRHDKVVVDHALVRPPDAVEGYQPASLVLTALLGSRWKAATTAGTALAMLMLVGLLPTLISGGPDNLLAVVAAQSWTILLLLAVTIRVRSISIGAVIRYWLAGMFSVVFLVSAIEGPLTSAAGWLISPLTQLVKVAPLLVAVTMGRRAWRHPGLSDLMLLGFASGAGFGFYESALWQQSNLSGLEANLGLLVPTIYQPDGLFVVGHAVWTSIMGLGIGLLLLHRHRAIAAMSALAAMLLVISDQLVLTGTALGETSGLFIAIRQLSFNGKLVGLIFVGGLATATILDRRRLASISARDHLFPNTGTDRSTPVDLAAGDDLVALFHIGRYRRRRIGAHTTVDATTKQWPPLSADGATPVAELARLGRAARVPIGPGTSSFGWVPESDGDGVQRFVGAAGFTPFLAVEPAADSTAPAAAISSPASRPTASGRTKIDRPDDFGQYFGVAFAALALYVFVRLLTAAAPSTALSSFAALQDAPTDLPSIRTAIGAVGAAIAIRGRNLAEIAPAWLHGSGDDPVLDLAQECEV